MLPRPYRPSLPTSSFALLLFVSVALLAPAAAAQSRSAGNDASFDDKADVVVVEVPVTVTDKNGEPARGLTADDFTILDNGKRRPLANFEVVHLDELVPAEDGRVKHLERQLPPAARRHFLLLFELSFSSPTGILRARHAARDFVVNQLHPTDLAAVATYSLEQGPRLLVTFTPDRAQLARAIETLGAERLGARGPDPLLFLVERPSSSSLNAGGGAQSRSVLNDAGFNASTTGEAALLAHLTVISKRMDLSQKSFERGRITSWARAMGSLARALDSVKGRKQVLLFSEGFDSRLLLGRQPSGVDAGQDAENLDVMQGRSFLVDSDDAYGNTQLQNDIDAMLEEFRRADCVVQAVDIGGLRAGSDVRGGIGNIGQEALFYMANETGGDLFKDANNLDQQLARMLNRSSTTYLLSFQPEDLDLDGSYHRLKVKVDGYRASRVAHRAGYYEPRPYPELHPLEKTLLASDAIASATPRRDIDLNVMAVPFKASEQSAYVPVILEIDGESLLHGHPGGGLQVEIYAYVTNERGEMRDFFTQVVSLPELRRFRPTLLESGLKYYGHLDLEPGDHLLRVLVRNATTGRTGVESVPLDVPAFGELTPVLLPPFFIDRGSSWILAKEDVAGNGQQTVVYPFIVDGEPYIPAVRPALKRRQEADLCLVAYNLGNGDVEVKSRILGPDGEEIAGGRFDLVERTVTGISGLDRLRATFQPRDLASGEYTLEVRITEASGATRTNSIPFSVL